MLHDKVLERGCWIYTSGKPVEEVGIFLFDLNESGLAKNLMVSFKVFFPKIKVLWSSQTVEMSQDATICEEFSWSDQVLHAASSTSKLVFAAPLVEPNHLLAKIRTRIFVNAMMKEHL